MKVAFRLLAFCISIPATMSGAESPSLGASTKSPATFRKITKGDQVLIPQTSETGSVTKVITGGNGTETVYEIWINNHQFRKYVQLPREQFLKSIYNYEGDGYQNVKLDDYVLDVSEKTPTEAKVVRIYEDGSIWVEGLYQNKGKDHLLPRSQIEKVVKEYPAGFGREPWRSGQKIFKISKEGYGNPGYITAVSEKGSVRFNMKMPDETVVFETMPTTKLTRSGRVEYWEGYLDKSPMPCIIDFSRIGKK